MTLPPFKVLYNHILRQLLILIVMIIWQAPIQCCGLLLLPSSHPSTTKTASIIWTMRLSLSHLILSHWLYEPGCLNMGVSWLSLSLCLNICFMYCMSPKTLPTLSIPYLIFSVSTLTYPFSKLVFRTLYRDRQPHTVNHSFTRLVALLCLDLVDNG